MGVSAWPHPAPLLSSHLGPGHKLVIKCPSASRSCPDPENVRAAGEKETQKNDGGFAGGVRAHDPCELSVNPVVVCHGRAQCEPDMLHPIRGVAVIDVSRELKHLKVKILHKTK